MHHTLVKGSSYQIWMPYDIPKQADLWVDPGWFLYDLWPQQYITLLPGVLPTKFDVHRAFLKQLDLWMTFDLGWGRHKNMLSNLVDPSPNAISNVSSIPRRTTKRIAVHTYSHTYSIILVFQYRCTIWYSSKTLYILNNCRFKVCTYYYFVGSWFIFSIWNLLEPWSLSAFA